MAVTATDALWSFRFARIPAPCLACSASLVPAGKASKHAGDNAGGEALCALAFSDPIYLHCLRLPTCSVRPYNILEKMADSLLVLRLG